VRLACSRVHHWPTLGLRSTAQKVCKSCEFCGTAKKSEKKCGLLPPKPTPEIIPWHTLAVDLVGPCKFGDPKKPKTYMELCVMTMIDPATGFFDCIEINKKCADCVASSHAILGRLRSPWIKEANLPEKLRSCSGMNVALLERQLPATSHNPQANSMFEHLHKTLHNMIRSAQIETRADLDPYLGWQGVLSACRRAINVTVHATSRATPTQLVFGRDAMLNTSFEADWQFVKERKQKLVIQNNKRENATQIPHTCNVGDIATVKAGTGCKHDKDPCSGE